MDQLRNAVCCSTSRGAIYKARAQEDSTLPFLHGVLYVCVQSATNLPNTDRQSKLKDSLHIKDLSDPYIIVCLDDHRIIKTSTINNDLNPVWNETFRIDVGSHTSNVFVKVYDMDIVGSDDHLGSLTFPAQKIIADGNLRGNFELLAKDGKPNGGKLKLDIRYKTADSLKHSIEVPECYFPMRKNCNVTLYQDAHVFNSELFSQVKTKGGKPYVPACAFKDMYEAIRGAQRLIYFTGWSLYTAVSLLREDDDNQVTLGELLTQKAAEGVRVLGLIWDEKLSTEVTPGLMGTHDEETARYFANTEVKLVLVPRQRDSCNVLTSQFISTCYSHHQKTVILDAEDKGGKRRLVAFVGGLDLTDGRWDTPEHSLYASMRTYHKQDFYNRCASVSVEAGPRQPWHDIHSRVEGRVAMDVLENFVERWKKQAHKHERLLVDIHSGVFSLDSAGSVKKADAWCVQMHRSINMDSALFNLDRCFGLTGKRLRARDDSIQRAYVHHIRRAKAFIYIENQYFLGSSRMWKKPESNASHLIPLEITNKICQMIREGKRFAVYVVLPMHPEGDPASAAVQEILYWQKSTMEMMYVKIVETLRKHGSRLPPTDYLNFFCLGKREAELPEGLPDPKPKSQEAILRESRRFMIYVHSKMLIVDDELILVGSANINQRSLGGNRDTEIAIGAHQPGYVMRKEGGELPQGEVSAFRLGLWAEHLGMVQPVFKNPASLDCVKAVWELSRRNWECYAAKKVCDLDGHLLAYPVKIEPDGTVKQLSAVKFFPDTSAHILGKRSSFLPVKLTT